MTSSFHPQRVHWFRAPLVQLQSCREVYHFVLCTVYYQGRSLHVRCKLYLLNCLHVDKIIQLLLNFDSSPNFNNKSNNTMNTKVLISSNPNDHKSTIQKMGHTKYTWHVPIFSMLGKTSKHQVFLVSGQATRSPLARGEWRMTARTSYLEARSIVGTVPIDCPYRTMFSVLRNN